MATELENASLKVVLNLEEARAEVDAIEAEQARRRAAKTPGYKAPEETPVARPSAGASAATGDKEPPLESPGSDARPASKAAGAETEAEAVSVPKALSEARKAVAFVTDPTASGAVHLAGELGKTGGAAAAEAVGLGAYAGPVGLAAATMLATAQQLAARGPGIAGFARGVGGDAGEAAASYFLTGNPAGLALMRKGWDYVASRLGALDDTKDDLVEIAAAQIRVGGRVDSRFLASEAGPIYRSHVQMDSEARARDAAEGHLRGEAGGRFFRDSLDDLIKGNR